MPLRDDVSTGLRLARSLWRSRITRRRLARIAPTMSRPAPGTVQIAVYFADAEVNLYQIRQWYGPLADLATTWPVTIISRSPAAALTLFDESPVPVVYARQVADLEQVIADQDLRVVLYVNQNSRNFQMMRYSRMWHVFINHGESDKMYMTTNQFKAYDYSLVAGQAALDRLRRKLWDYDLEKRAIPIGRPQTDHLEGVPPFPADDRVVVLYAPTWEGDRAAASYGSIVSHGLAAVRALVATGRHRVIYRPHPRSGVVDADYKAANDEIMRMLTAENLRDPSAHHVVDTGAELGWQLRVADVAITDISAMVYDRLATGRPIIVTRPVHDDALVDLDGFLGDADWLDAAEATSVVDVVTRVLVSTESQERLQSWVRHHFGDTTAGAATQRFRTAIEHLMGEWETHAALHPATSDDAGDHALSDLPVANTITPADDDDETIIRRV
ncbi:CDP-glycerol glycerophosphotransferase family protein [Marisediminicola sp. LYQ85]|uniref:CDP-glycerol glycerophosphotransferase family protein n=1 Tax=Marisediminicola sp. LYQ85 TaxID=3391062 RepID=UPI003983BB12